MIQTDCYPSAGNQANDGCAIHGDSQCFVHEPHVARVLNQKAWLAFSNTAILYNIYICGKKETEYFILIFYYLVSTFLNSFKQIHIRILSMYPISSAVKKNVYTLMNQSGLKKLHMNCCFKNPRVTLSSPSVYVKLRQRVWGEWGIFHVTQKCSHALLSISIAHYTHFNQQAQTWQQLNIYYTSIQPSGLCENTLPLQKHLFCLSYKPWLLYDLWRGWHGFKRSWCLWSLLLVYIWLPEMLSVTSLLDLCLLCPFYFREIFILFCNVVYELQVWSS